MEGTGGFTLLDELLIKAQPVSGSFRWSGERIFLYLQILGILNSVSNEDDISDINLTAIFTRQTFNFSVNSEANGRCSTQKVVIHLIIPTPKLTL